MKKFTITIILMALICVICASTVYAGSVTASLTSSKTTAKQGDEVTFTLSIKSTDNKGMNVLETVFSYDESILEYTGVTFLNGWSGDINTDSKKLAAVTMSASTGEIATLKFKVKSDAKVGNATISATNISVIDLDEETYTAPNATRTISIETNAADVKPTNGTPNTNNTIPKVNTTTNKANTANTIPYTGVEDWVMPIGFIAIIAAAVGYVFYKKYNMV